MTIDSDAKDLIKKTQKVIYNEKKVNLDLKDLVYLIFKNPERAAELVNENFSTETNEDQAD